MRSRYKILFAALSTVGMFAGCTGKKAADNESGPRLSAPPAPTKQTDKPRVNMPLAPPPPPAPPNQ